MQEGMVGLVEVTERERKMLSKDLFYAAERGRLIEVHGLISKGADVNATDYTGKTPLHYAATFNKLSISNILLKAGANVNAVDCLGKTPLHYAAEIGGLESINFLLNAGASANIIDANGDTALHVVAKPFPGTKHAVVQSIFDAGANLNTFNNKGITPKIALKRCTIGWVVWSADNLCTNCEGADVGRPYVYSLASLCAGEMTDGISKDEIEQRSAILNAYRESVTKDILAKVYPLLQSVALNQKLTQKQKMTIEHIASALIVSTHCKRENMSNVKITTDATVEFLNELEMAAAKNAVLAEIARSKREVGPSVNEGVRGIMKECASSIMEKLIASPNFDRLKAEMRKSCYDVIGDERLSPLLQNIPAKLVVKIFPALQQPSKLLQIAIERADIIEPDNEIKITGLNKYPEVFSSLERLGATKQLTEVLGIQDPIAAAQETVVARVAARCAAMARELKDKALSARVGRFLTANCEPLLRLSTYAYNKALAGRNAVASKARSLTGF